MIKNGGGLFPYSEKFWEEEKSMSGELHRVCFRVGGEQSDVQVSVGHSNKSHSTCIEFDTEVISTWWVQTFPKHALQKSQTMRVIQMISLRLETSEIEKGCIPELSSEIRSIIQN